MPLSSNVITCEYAAKVKGIPLRNELKTLILTTDKGLYVLNLPGNMYADFRAVKRYLGVNEACLASLEDLKKLGFQKGTVCPALKKYGNCHSLYLKKLCV